MKLCLGTVQFGMDYGVFKTPRKDPQYCVNCLDYATQNGIDAIDTATAYGVAEEIVGHFLKQTTIPRDRLYISTKALPNIMDECDSVDYVKTVRGNLQHSLLTMHTDYVDTYYYHSSRYAFNQELLDAISDMKKEGLARSVGVSVYYPDEAEACFDYKACKDNKGVIDNISCIQAPYSIFDHRMKEAGIFEKGKQYGFGIDVRTAFIKGLIRLKKEEVPIHLAKAIPILEKLDRLCERTGYTRIDLAIGYIKRETDIDHLVFGIRTMDQLKEDIASFEKNIPDEIFCEIDKDFKEISADIVVPSLWAQ